LKFAFSANAFRRYDLIETIRILTELGYQGIEILADIPHAYPPDLTGGDVQKIRAALDDNGLALSNINAFMLHAIQDTYHPSWIEHESSKRAQRIGYTLQCIDLAAQLGIDILSTEPGGPLMGMEQQEGLNFFKEGLAAIYQKARDNGIRILIEPEPGLLIENSVQIRSLLDDLDPDVFGLNFDIGHFFCVGEDPSACIREMRDVIYHFHIEDIAATREHHHLLPGKGAIDFPSVFKAIEDIEYDGFITVELYPYDDQPVEAARQALAYLQAVAPGSG